MELHEQHLLPHGVKLLLGVLVRLVFDGRDSGKQLQVTENDLSPPVVEFVVGLGGVCATVQLKVELAIPCHEGRCLAFQSLKEVVDRVTQVDAREEADGVADAAATPQLFEMLPGRATAAVTLSKDEQRGGVLV